MALAKDVDFPAAVGTFHIAHVLHQAQHGDVHHLGHLHRLGDDHAHQLLGGGDNEDAVQGQGLEHGQRRVAGAGRHIHKHVIHVAPDDVGPKLLDGPGDDGPAPHHGGGLLLQQQVDAHHLDAGLGGHGVNAVFIGEGPLLHAKALGDGGAGDVGIQHSHIAAAAAQAGGKQRGDEAFAHAALAADHADDLFHMA